MKYYCQYDNMKILESRILLFLSGNSFFAACEIKITSYSLTNMFNSGSTKDFSPLPYGYALVRNIILGFIKHFLYIEHIPLIISSETYVMSFSDKYGCIGSDKQRLQTFSVTGQPSLCSKYCSSCPLLMHSFSIINHCWNAFCL